MEDKGSPAGVSGPCQGQGVAQQLVTHRNGVAHGAQCGKHLVFFDVTHTTLLHQLTDHLGVWIAWGRKGPGEGFQVWISIIRRTNRRKAQGSTSSHNLIDQCWKKDMSKTARRQQQLSLDTAIGVTCSTNAGPPPGPTAATAATS